MHDSLKRFMSPAKGYPALSSSVSPRSHPVKFDDRPERKRRSSSRSLPNITLTVVDSIGGAHDHERALDKSFNAFWKTGTAAWENDGSRVQSYPSSTEGKPSFQRRPQRWRQHKNIWIDASSAVEAVGVRDDDARTTTTTVSSPTRIPSSASSVGANNGASHEDQTCDSSSPCTLSLSAYLSGVCEAPSEGSSEMQLVGVSSKVWADGSLGAALPSPLVWGGTHSGVTSSVCSDETDETSLERPCSTQYCLRSSDTQLDAASPEFRTDDPSGAATIVPLSLRCDGKHSRVPASVCSDETTCELPGTAQYSEGKGAGVPTLGTFLGMENPSGLSAALASMSPPPPSESMLAYPPLSCFLDESERAPEDPLEKVWITPVETTNFEYPVLPLSCAAGTTTFYSLRYAPQRVPDYIRSDTFWVGKDMAHAESESEFYDELRSFVVNESIDRPWRDLALEWCCASAGVLETKVCIEDGAEDAELKEPPSPRKSVLNARSRPQSSVLGPDVRQLLVLENLCGAANKLRMLDLKIGAVTALGGWKGKSRLRAFRNHQVDRLTNSSVEYFRLEGIQNPPARLDGHIEASKRTTIASLSDPKKVARMTLQRMRASRFLAFWLDCRDVFPCGTTCEQYAHIVLMHTIRKLHQMVTTLGQLEAPQVWIGSSIGLGFDAEPPKRVCPDGKLDEEAIVQLVTVKAFDWGRSELNSPEKNKLLSPKELKMRGKYWMGYLKGAYRLLWECARYYIHRAASPEWQSMVFELALYHSMHDHEVVASVHVPINGNLTLGVPCTLDLVSERGVQAQLTVTISKNGSSTVVHVNELQLVRRRPARFLIGCVAFSETPDALEYLTMGVKRHLCPRRVRIQGRVNTHYTALLEPTGDNFPACPRYSSGEVVEFMVDPSGENERTLLEAVGLLSHGNAEKTPKSWGFDRRCAVEQWFPASVGNTVQDDRCADAFRNELLPVHPWH